MPAELSQGAALLIPRSRDHGGNAAGRGIDATICRVDPKLEIAEPQLTFREGDVRIGAEFWKIGCATERAFRGCSGRQEGPEPLQRRRTANVDRRQSAIPLTWVDPSPTDLLGGLVEEGQRLPELSCAEEILELDVQRLVARRDAGWLPRGGQLEAIRDLHRVDPEDLRERQDRRRRGRVLPLLERADRGAGNGPGKAVRPRGELVLCEA